VAQVRFTPQDEEFRAEVRAWLEASLTGEFAGLRGAGGPGREHERHDERLAWNRHLAAAGWTCLGWPAEHGGRGATLTRQVIFYEEYAQAGAPARVSIVGEELLGPTLIAFGTPEQQRRFLPPIAAVTELWCQGYSEPGAGSDLAGVTTRAALDGAEWRIDGQKIWTSHAQEADLMYTLVRTSSEGRKQSGITLLVVPLSTPGIEVRPIPTIDGWHHVNEVFLDDVAVPVANRIGDEGGGWTCAKFLLDRERLSPATVPRLARQLDQVEEMLRRRLQDQGASPSLHGMLERLFLAQASVRGAREMLLSAIQEEMAGTLAAAKSSALKLHCSELAQQISALAYDACAPWYAPRLRPLEPAPDGSDERDAQRQLVHTHRFFRSRTIAGGTSEVQKNVIARDLFGA
jgi:alkylation response protein AidB-like acyl-CoA dehydrogenase